MAISALPQSSVQLLGSAISITSPYDLVKELLDNAIDARATSIEVSISPDTLERITVKDDGHGISFEDFDALGRRAHTSKLKSFEELQTRFSEDLGFRGEALASINSFAEVAITTRTAADPVATRIQLKFGSGGVDIRRPVSAPTGTTVQALKLFENFPARKQFASRNKKKNILSIKDLLKAHALARPNLKLTLKIHGDPARTWTYSPTHPSTTYGTVSQIFGKNLAKNCIEISHYPRSAQSLPSQGKETLPTHLAISGIIPKPVYDTGAVHGKGVYISVNSRPVSSSRGFAKKATSIIKSYLSRSSANEARRSLTSPFIQLEVRCPANLYDSNVTPLKDEVLFADERALLEHVEGLCAKAYSAQNIFKVDHIMEPRAFEHRDSPCMTSNDIIISQGLSFRDMPQRLEGQSTSGLVPLGHLTALDEPEGLPRSSSIVASEMGSRENDRQSSQPLLKTAKMRTVNKVDMSRTFSNETDEMSISETLEVQVPSLQPHLTPIHNPKIRPIIMDSTYGADIRHYLQPEKNDRFHILEDNTATQSTSKFLSADLHDSESTGFSKGSDRRPLLELTDSMLNQLQEISDSDAEVSGGELQTQASRDVRQRAPQELVAPAQHVATHSLVHETTGRSYISPYDSPPLRSGHQRNQVTPRGANRISALQTPPSSDPRHQNRNANPPFVYHRNGRDSMANASQAQASARPSNISGSRGVGLWQSRMSIAKALHKSPNQHETDVETDERDPLLGFPQLQTTRNFHSKMPNQAWD